MKLTERCRYVRAKYSSSIDNLYLYPVKKLAQIVGDDFLKDFALGKGVIQGDALPPEYKIYSCQRNSIMQKSGITTNNIVDLVNVRR